MKRSLLMWSRWLETFCDNISDRITTYMARKQHSYQEFVLQDKLEQQRRDNKFLQLQLTKTRADLHELQIKPQMLRDSIFKTLQMTDEQLRDISRFPVRNDGSSTGWETVTGFCCLGGCDMDVYPFRSERDALLFSVLLKAVGYQPPHNIVCDRCYKEYMSENLGGINSYAE